MNKKRFISVLVLLLIFALAIPLTAQDMELPEQITIEFENLLPEGIEWDPARGQFLVGSHMFGTIYTVDDDGTVTPFIEDEDLVLTNGIHIDHERGRLLVATTDTPTPVDCEAVREANNFTGLGIYDLETGERLHMVDLTGLYPLYGGFANDVTVDADGNAYVTDWCAGGVYKVDMEGNASTIFTGDPFYIASPLGFGANNGIDWHPDNYLIVSGGFATGLYKVTLDAPISITPIGTAPMFADGVTILPSGEVVVIGALLFDDPETPFIPATIKLSSDDDWASASIDGSMMYARFGTTGVLRDGEFYSVLSGVIEPLPVSMFEIIQIDFDNMDE